MNTAARICSAAGLSIAIGVTGARVAIVADAASAIECTAAALQAKAPQGTTITAASTVAAKEKLPEYCRVDGNVATPGNKVNFRLGLPASWNGKYYFLGSAGSAARSGRSTPGSRAGNTGTGSTDEAANFRCVMER